MEKQILQYETAADRLEHLKNSADKVEKFTYPRELDSGEIQELQSQLSQDMIYIDKQDQILKMAKEVYKAETKGVKQQIAAGLQMIRAQVEEVTDDVYLMKDLEAGRMGYYSKEGKLVFDRSLKADEMQYSITDNLRKAQ